MGTYLAHIGEFIWAVVVAWRNLAAVAVFCLFSFPNAILSTDQRSRFERSWPPERRRKWLMGAAIAYIFVACFFAWDNQRMDAESADIAKNTAETRSACLAKQLTVKNDRAYKKSQLEKYYINGGVILYENLPKDISIELFNKYVSEYNTWFHDTSEWIKSNLGDAALAKFIDYGAGFSFNWDRAVNTNHNIINLLTTLRKNLSELIQYDTWDGAAALESCS